MRQNASRICDLSLCVVGTEMNSTRVQLFLRMSVGKTAPVLTASCHGCMSSQLLSMQKGLIPVTGWCFPGPICRRKQHMHVGVDFLMVRTGKPNKTISFCVCFLGLRAQSVLVNKISYYQSFDKVLLFYLYVGSKYLRLDLCPPLL